MAYVRIDKFNEVCEKVGILNSEEILTQFAEILRKRMHPRDVAGRFEGTAEFVQRPTKTCLEIDAMLDRNIAKSMLAERLRILLVVRLDSPYRF